MGVIQGKDFCCMKEERKSILELSIFDNSFDSEFVRDSNYESPIPDEVYSYSPIHKDKSFTVDDDSTDIEKGFEVTEEPNKNYPRKSSIEDCTHNLWMLHRNTYKN
ncbi:hypothetical protein SteCoe_12814 [Stentor coeruleus]|uniref:Uncharacterized protein n=1 Tax=Stentor coeruleus TaxID=5963 RepID=A0A1R2C9Y6_9CILI|nr:hypothetical protein SteCoe_12814 [Stentor coeruleus]